MKNKLIATIILISILTMTVSGVLLYPKQSKAEYDISNLPVSGAIRTGSQVIPTGLPVTEYGLRGQGILNSIWETIKSNWKIAADMAYKNSLRYFLAKVAYDTAAYIATGGAGQKPLFISDWKEYFKQTTDEAVGVFFEKLSRGGDGYCDGYPDMRCSKDSQCPALLPGEMGPPAPGQVGKCIGAWGGIGIDLCEPLDPLIKIRLSVAAKRSLEPRKPRCNWTQIKKNLDDVRNMKLDQLVDFSTTFHPGANELGSYLLIRSSADDAIRRNTQQKNLQSIVQQGFEPVINPITGIIKTPAKTISDTLSLSTEKAFVPDETYTDSPVANMVGVFTNTLISKLLEKVFKKGFNPYSSGQAVMSDFWTLGGRQAAKLLFGDLMEINYRFNVGMRTDEFTIEGEQQFNEVVDNSFSQAIEEKCTLGQAIGFYKDGDDAYRGECNGLIIGSADFGFTQDGVEPSYLDGIPYRSILVLRKFRIVPVGWEIAAQYYKDFDDRRSESLTLNRLVNLYDKKESPYYKLVDPDWLLTMPATRCVRQGAGPQKIEQDPYCTTALEEGRCPDGYTIYPFQRLDYCADYESCLQENDKGGCDSNDWGYCIEEKDVWDIQGTQCRERYNSTCQTVANQESGKRSSYLLNTVSGYTDSVCYSNTAPGCREYCTTIQKPFNEEDWTCQSFASISGSGAIAAERGDSIYLNSQSEKCGARDEGCHLYYSSSVKDQSEVTVAHDARSDDENAYGLLKENYVKLAPDYYKCNGYTQPVTEYNKKEDCEAANSDYYWRNDLRRCVASGYEQCSNFTKHCELTDVNCKLYNPTSNTGPAVPAVIVPKICPDDDIDCDDEIRNDITWNDECPTSCVGYQTYHQEETTFELAKDFDLIADTGQSCSSPGCDEFTNLDEVAKGGEGIEYYSYLRQCIKPEEGGWDTYYTWEGSDTAGYQLKKWELKRGVDGGPHYLEGGAGPNNQGCNLTDEDCREFFDKNLAPYRRYFSKTVSVSDDCHPFRRSGETEREKCFEPNKNWNNKICIYNAIPSQGIKCSASNNLCREYKSNRGYNYQKLVENYFTRADDMGGWSGNVDISNESVRRGDYSLNVSGNMEHDLTFGDLEQGKIYTLEFLAKGSGTFEAGFTAGTQRMVNQISLEGGSEWHHYRLQLPLKVMDMVFDLSLENQKLIINTNAYVDNIVLKKMESYLLIKNSWQTPEECENLSPLPNGDFKDMIGCEAYRDNNRNDVNLRNFTNLCFEDVVGCELVIDSENTKSKNDDKLTYLVLNNKFSCDENALNCTRLGLITPDRDDDTLYIFEDAYKIVDPADNFQKCNLEEVFCQSYIDKENNTYNFKNPLERTCEFKKKGNVGDWYKSGIDELCRGPISGNDYARADDFTGEDVYQKHCVGGVSLLDDGSCNEDRDCTNLAYPGKTGLCVDWVGLCKSNSSGCREYQDPQEPEECVTSYVNYEHLYTPIDEEKVCNYYYYKDVETCDHVNPSHGCAGFYQTLEKEAGTKSIRSYKVCVKGNELLEGGCETDSDCGVDSGYECRYTNIDIK